MEENIAEIMENESCRTSETGEYYDCINESTESSTSSASSNTNLDAINANLTDEKKTEETKKQDYQNHTRFEEALRNKMKVMNLEFNTETKAKINEKKKDDKLPKNLQLNTTFQEAQRNKMKVLNLEFNSNYKSKTKTDILPLNNNLDTNLTDAQKNKLKVMRAEFQIFQDDPNNTTNIIVNSNTNLNDTTTTDNDNKTEIIDSKNDSNILNINGNLASPGQELIMNAMHRNNILSLPKHIEQLNIVNSNITTLQIDTECQPMSIGSTPNTENPSELVTPSTSKLQISDSGFETARTLDTARTIDTGTSIFTEDGFKFPTVEQKKLDYAELKNKSNILEHAQKCSKQMRLTKEEVNQIFCNNIQILLTQSISMPLEAQMKLVNSEILKFFLDDLNLFSHLHSLRCYYFLLDGEFGRHITEGIFNKLYEVKKPIDLLNGRCLQLIMNRALCASSKVHENSERLSFTIQNIPQKFDLSSADVLDCLSMSYKITWPLNILLPRDTIEKYEQVFKYLLKLHHISWILQKTFQVKMSLYFDFYLDLFGNWFWVRFWFRKKFHFLPVFESSSHLFPVYTMLLKMIPSIISNKDQIIN